MRIYEVKYKIDHSMYSESEKEKTWIQHVTAGNIEEAIKNAKENYKGMYATADIFFVSLIAETFGHGESPKILK
jgi:hypothetical protein